MDYGLDIKLTFVISVVLLSIPLASAFDITIGITEEIDTSIFDINVIAGPPQKYSLIWQNTGSTSCQSRTRMEIYNTQNQRVFTSWSGLKRLSPSQEAESRFYSNLPPGQYTLSIRIYHCNEVFEQEPINMSVSMEQAYTGTIDFISYSVREGFLDVSVRSDQDLDSVAIVPEGFPVGWIFSQGFIERLPAWETRTVTIPFEPSVWVDRKIALSAFSENGEYYGQKDVVIRKPETTQDNTYIYLLVIVFVIAIIAVISFLYHTKIKLLWKRQ
jgi:hypothetical protein